MGEIVRITLKGPDAEPGRIPAADVAKLLTGYERVVARAAEVRVRRAAKTGRRGVVVESTTRLIYRRTRKGSFVLELELPDLQVDDELELEFVHLGGDAARDVQQLLAEPAATGNADPRVLDAVDQLLRELDIGGEHYESMRIAWSPKSLVAGKRPRPVLVDKERRAELESGRRVLPAQDVREDAFLGVLVEADFEKRTAGLRTSDGQRVDLLFADGQADLIQQWLRRPGELRGLVEYSNSGHVRRIELTAIESSHQHDLFDPAAFWDVQPVHVLAAAQGVHPINDLEELAASDLTGEEFDAFLAAIGS